MRNRKTSSFYWRIVRRCLKQDVKKAIENEDFSIRDVKSIVNDYNYSDFSVENSFKEKIPK
jgi:hypothetical protein